MSQTHNDMGGFFEENTGTKCESDSLGTEAKKHSTNVGANFEEVNSNKNQVGISVSAAFQYQLSSGRHTYWRGQGWINKSCQSK